MTDLSLSPCPYMRSALERLARGERGCLWLWYARIHTIRCPRCRKALDALKKYFEIIRPDVGIAEASFDWERFGQELDAMEARSKGERESGSPPREVKPRSDD